MVTKVTAAGFHRGQALVETALIIVLLTGMFFATLQLCLVAVNDLCANEAAFSAMRAAVVAPAAEVNRRAESVASQLMFFHWNRGHNVHLNETRVWNEEIRGHQLTDHSGGRIMKYTTNVRYSVSMMFAELFRLSPYNPWREQSARSRMVRSPGEDYFYRGYPDAQPFRREPE